MSYTNHTNHRENLDHIRSIRVSNEINEFLKQLNSNRFIKTLIENSKRYRSYMQEQEVETQFFTNNSFMD